MRILSCLSSIPRKWRTPKTLIGLFVLELCLTVPALALYGIAQPDLYRTRFWQEGSDHGWNSNPDQLVYDFANYRPAIAPLPWSQFITNFNVIISVLSMFLLLCKMIMFITHCFLPLLSLVIHATLVALYAVSIHAQAAPDMSDLSHPQSGAPWYITKSCGPPVSPKLKGYCIQAKGAFSVTILLCALFLTYLILAIISLFPTASQRSSTRTSKTSDSESMRVAQPWEMNEVPRTPGTTGGMRSPTTPRTTAFNTLSGNKGKAPMRSGNGSGNGRLPLRHHISMGDETYSGPNGR